MLLFVSDVMLAPVGLTLEREESEKGSRDKEEACRGGFKGLGCDDDSYQQGHPL